MSEKIQRFTSTELCLARWNQDDTFCRASDVAPLEARVKELEEQVRILNLTKQWRPGEEQLAQDLAVIDDMNEKLRKNFARAVELLKRLEASYEFSYGRAIMVSLIGEVTAFLATLKEPV